MLSKPPLNSSTSVAYDVIVSADDALATDGTADFTATDVLKRWTQA